MHQCRDLGMKYEISVVVAEDYHVYNEFTISLFVYGFTRISVTIYFST